MSPPAGVCSATAARRVPADGRRGGEATLNYLLDTTGAPSPSQEGRSTSGQAQSPFSGRWQTGHLWNEPAPHMSYPRNLTGSTFAGEERENFLTYHQLDGTLPGPRSDGS